MVNGARHNLWRAVGRRGNILDILAHRRRDRKATKTCFRKRLKG